MIDFDVETTGLQWYHHEVFLVQFQADEGEPVALKHPEDREEIQAWLSRDEGYRAWNSKFDLHFLKAMGYTIPPPEHWHDGMVRAALCDERFSNALAARHDRLFAGDARADEKAMKKWLSDEKRRRKAASKETGEEYEPPNYGDVPDELMIPYALGDVIQTREVDNVYAQLIGQVPELVDLYELEMKVMPALFAAEERGMLVERAAAVKFENALIPRLEKIHDEIQALANFDNFNPNSAIQLAEALQRRGADLSLVDKTPSGRLSMDAENLAAVDDPLAEKMLELRGTEKVYNTYVKPMLHDTVNSQGIPRKPFLDENDRLHTSFNQVGARTGRMSSSDPNVQNWHRDNLDLRYLVQAAPGHSLVCVDLNAIEARVLAAYAPGGDLKQIILSGDDLHTHTAEGVGLTDRRRSDGSIETARNRAKVFLYSVMYGAGIKSLRKQFRVSSAECKNMLNRFHATYPEIGELQRRIEASLVDTGYIKTAWGRRQRPYGTKSWEIEREGYKFLNYLIQGTAADIIKASTVACHERGVPIIAVVHDEIIAEVPTPEAPAVADTIVECMVDHPRITKAVPLEAEAEIVTRWSEAKNRDFVPSYL